MKKHHLLTLILVFVLLFVACKRPPQPIPTQAASPTNTATQLPAPDPTPITTATIPPIVFQSPQRDCLEDFAKLHGLQEVKVSNSGTQVFATGRPDRKADYHAAWVIDVSTCSATPVATDLFGPDAQSNFNLDSADRATWTPYDTQVIFPVEVIDLSYEWFPYTLCTYTLADRTTICNNYTDVDDPAVQEGPEGLRIWMTNYAHYAQIERYSYGRIQQITEWYRDYWYPFPIRPLGLVGMMTQLDDGTIACQLRELYDPEVIIHTIENADTCISIGGDIYFTRHNPSLDPQGLWKQVRNPQDHKFPDPVLVAPVDYKHRNWLMRELVADPTGTYFAAYTASETRSPGIWFCTSGKCRVVLDETDDILYPLDFISLDGYTFLIVHRISDRSLELHKVDDL